VHVASSGLKPKVKLRSGFWDFPRGAGGNITLSLGPPVWHKGRTQLGPRRCRCTVHGSARCAGTRFPSGSNSHSVSFGAFDMFSLTATPRRMHRVSFDLRSWGLVLPRLRPPQLQAQDGMRMGEVARRCWANRVTGIAVSAGTAILHDFFLQR
jgi:hypothetical protein